MRILIITYSREVNPGTFLQAYGVQYAFDKLYPGAQIDLLKHKRLYSISGGAKGGVAPKKDWNWLKGRISAIPRRLKYEWNYKTKFHLTDKEFDLFDYDKDEFIAFANSYDLVVVGSDTILVNLKKGDNYGLMWLLGVKTNKVLFAASAAPANYDLTSEEVKMLREQFSTYKYLGVRDSVTYKLLHDRIGLGDEVYRMFDPTYLIPSTKFSLPFFIKIKLSSIRHKKKIAVVNFNDLFERKKDISLYLKSKGYYVISTLHNAWADMNLMTLSPFEWGALYGNVDLTVTERFHDSVFNLRNDTPVIAIDWRPTRFASDGTSKCQNLLESYGLTELHYIYKERNDIDAIKGVIDNVNEIFDKYKCQDYNKLINNNYNTLLQRITKDL